MYDLLTTECPCIVKNLALSKEKVWLSPLASGKYSVDPWNANPARGYLQLPGSLQSDWGVI